MPGTLLVDFLLGGRPSVGKYLLPETGEATVLSARPHLFPVVLTDRLFAVITNRELIQGAADVGLQLKSPFKGFGGSQDYHSNVLTSLF